MMGALFIPTSPHGCATRRFSSAFGHELQPLAPHWEVGQPSHAMHMAVPGTRALGARKCPALLRNSNGEGAAHA